MSGALCYTSVTRCFTSVTSLRLITTTRSVAHSHARYNPLSRFIFVTHLWTFPTRPFQARYTSVAHPLHARYTPVTQPFHNRTSCTHPFVRFRSVTHGLHTRYTSVTPSVLGIIHYISINPLHIRYTPVSKPSQPSSTHPLHSGYTTIRCIALTQPLYIRETTIITFHIR